MKHLLFMIILVAFVSISFSACTPTKSSEFSTTSCTTKGIIKDMTQLDGCKIMIELEDGTRLHPVEYVIEIPTLKDGDKITFSYEAVEAMTICMAGQTVKITCLEIQ